MGNAIRYTTWPTLENLEKTDKFRCEFMGFQSSINPDPWSDSQEYMITNLEFQVFIHFFLIALLPTLSSPHPLLDQLDLLSGLLYHFRS